MYRIVPEGGTEAKAAAPAAGDPLLPVLAEAAAAALRRYGLTAPPPALVNLSENATFRVDGADGRPAFALRLHRPGYHSLAAIRSELAWLAALRRDGAALTPVVVAGLDGEPVQAVDDPRLGRRHVVLFRWEAGSEPAGNSLGDFRALGRIAARMHRHVATWTRPAGFERHTWDFATSLGDRPHWGRWRDGVGVDPQTGTLFGRTVAAIGRRLARYGKGPERFGLIHADMRLANLLVDGDRLKVIDFDDCGFGWFLYDAATAVSFFEDGPAVPGLLAAWADGYREVSPLGSAEEAEIPTFVMLRRLLLVAWIGSHSETDLARAMGAAYTAGTAVMCDRWLARFER